MLTQEQEQLEHQLKVLTMQANLTLKTKQAFWETPRNLVLICSALVAGTAAVAGLAGYKIGQNSPQPVQIIFQSGAVAPSLIAPGSKG